LPNWHKLRRELDIKKEGPEGSGRKTFK
jgi:hypothetical protein